MSTNNTYKYSTLTAEELEEWNEVIQQFSFESNVNSFVWYRSILMLLVSLVFVPLYGIGLIGLIYTPIYAYIQYCEIKSRKLFVTPEVIVYKSQPPAFLPCLGTSTYEKHVLLALVTDVAIDQSWFAAWFGLRTARIENAGQGGPAINGKASADLSFTGLDDPKGFKNFVLKAVSAKRNGSPLTSEVLAQPMPAQSPQLDQLNTTMLRIESLLARQQVVPTYVNQ